MPNWLPNALQAGSEMPLDEPLRHQALAYIEAHLFDEPQTRSGFSFIHDAALVELITLELKSARYVYRLMEMLDLKDTFFHPFCKFQIVQYAGIFEAAIDYLLFDRKYQSTRLRLLIEEKRAELEKHTTVAYVSGFSSKLNVQFDGIEAKLAIQKISTKPRMNIRFEDKVTSCLELSFLDARLSDEILAFYEQRNSVHLAARLKKAITIEVRDAKRGYRRINAFCENVKRGMRKFKEPLLPPVPAVL